MADETYRYKMDFSKPKGTIHSNDDRAYTQQLPGYKKGVYGSDGKLLNNDNWNPGCGEIINKNRKQERDKEAAEDKAKLINSMHPDMIDLIKELKLTVFERLDAQDDVISSLSAKIAKQDDEIIRLQAKSGKVKKESPTESPNPDESPNTDESKTENQTVDDTAEDSEASASLAEEVGSVDNTDADEEESEFDYKAWAFDTESTHHQTVRKMLRDKFGQDKKTKYDMVEYLVELGFLTREEALETEPFKAKA